MQSNYEHYESMISTFQAYNFYTENECPILHNTSISRWNYPFRNDWNCNTGHICVKHAKMVQYCETVKLTQENAKKQQSNVMKWESVQG